MSALQEGLWELERRALCDDAGAAAVLAHVADMERLHCGLDRRTAELADLHKELCDRCADIAELQSRLAAWERRQWVWAVVLVLALVALVLMAPGEW